MCFINIDSTFYNTAFFNACFITNLLVICTRKAIDTQAKPSLLVIAYIDTQIRDICEDSTIAEQKLDVAVVESLKKRLADIDAANVVTDLVEGNAREMEEDKKLYQIDLNSGYRLVFCANHPNGETDWGRVSRIQIRNIEQYK